MGGRIKFKKFKIKIWQLLVFLIPLLFINATLLRLDHIKMVDLRDAVLKADEEEDDEKIASALNELRNFVSSNVVVNVVEDNGTQKVMFGTGPFYLEHQYLRAAHKALDEAEKNMQSDSNPNGNIYAKATEVCRPQAIKNGWNWTSQGYINCMMTEINKYPAAAEIQDTILANVPSTEMYRHNYSSPVWAPTFSGFFLLITLAVIVVIFIRLLGWAIIRLSLLFIR